MRRLFVTSLVQANNCAHMYRLKTSGVEPLPMQDSAKAGILFERALSFYLPRSENVTAELAIKASDDYLADEQTKSFIHSALENLPPSLLQAEDVIFSLPAERFLNELSLTIAGFIDLVADGEIYELKYTQKYMNQPSKTHIFQVQHYMFLLDKDEANIVYACNTKKPAVVSFKVRRWSERKYFALLKALSQRYHEQGPTGLIHDWQCDYCSFRHVCEYYAEQNEITLSYESKLP